MAPKTRNQRLNGLHPLSYLGVNPTTPTNFIVDNRAPTVNDYAEFDLGDIWLDESSLPTPPTAENIYMLVDKSGGIATWANFASGVMALESLTGNTGGAVFGDGSNNINVIGDGTSITVAGNPGTNTLTISPGTNGTPITKLHTQDGNDVTPTLGVINLSGFHNLTTTGTVGPNTATVNMNNAITLGDLANLAAGVPALTIATGDITFTATNNVGNLGFPNTHSSGNAGVIEFNGIRYFHNYNAGRDHANVFVGANAGNFTLDGLVDSRNTGVGELALNGLTTGAHNSALGTQALWQCTTGIQNSALGGDALGALTTGSRNSAFGFESSLAITTGSYNLSFGQISLAELTTGSYNIAIGSGEDNAGDRTSALGNLSTGQWNIAIGGEVSTTVGGAGRSYTGAEDSNIVIGHLALGTLGESNTIRIGSQTAGSGDGEQNRAFITGIYGVTPAGATQSVIIDANGQLGSTASSMTLLTYTNVNTTPYVVLSTDVFLGVDCSGGAIIIQLPNAPSTGRVIIIKDRTGSANTNNITVTTVGGAVNLDGATSYTMNTQYSSINVLFDGSTYQIY